MIQNAGRCTARDRGECRRYRRLRGASNSGIGQGFLVLLGVHVDDTDSDARYLAEKVAHLRVLEDEDGKLNLSLLDKAQSALVVSNFTLYGDCRKGRRPAFTEAARGEHANTLYRAFGARAGRVWRSCAVWRVRRGDAGVSPQRRPRHAAAGQREETLAKPLPAAARGAAPCRPHPAFFFA